MSKVNEVMTRTLATCTPDANIAHVAALMRDYDVGDVLVVENGKLRGIVTDRDLALQALSGKHNPQLTPIRKIMSTKIITGEPNWSMKQAAKSMARHQIRRLPIVQDGRLVGIVSLADVARYERQKDIVSRSLKAISTPNNVRGMQIARQGAAVISLGLAALAATMLVWLTWNRSGQTVRKQMEQNKFYQALIRKG